MCARVCLPACLPASLPLFYVSSALVPVTEHYFPPRLPVFGTSCISRAKSEVTLEARVYTLLYVSLIAAGTMFPAFGAALLNYWVIPSVMGQPFLRFYLFAEHRGCEENPSSVLTNTRTMKTNWLYRKLAWEMPYHMEHHCQLPLLLFQSLTDFPSLAFDKYNPLLVPTCLISIPRLVLSW